MGLGGETSSADWWDGNEGMSEKGCRARSPPSPHNTWLGDWGSRHTEAKILFITVTTWWLANGSCAPAPGQKVCMWLSECMVTCDTAGGLYSACARGREAVLPVSLNHACLDYRWQPREGKRYGKLVNVAHCGRSCTDTHEGSSRSGFQLRVGREREAGSPWGLRQ